MQGVAGLRVGRVGVLQLSSATRNWLAFIVTHTERPRAVKTHSEASWSLCVWIRLYEINYDNKDRVLGKGRSTFKTNCLDVP